MLTKFGMNSFIPFLHGSANGDHDSFRLESAAEHRGDNYANA